MPNTAKTDIEVAQRAMVLVGMEPLSSFTESTDEALVMNTTYEDLVEDCLAQNNWNFATGQIVLSRLADTPIDRWDSAYAMPTEPAVIQVQTVTVGKVVQTYDIYEKYIYINAQANEEVVLNYIYRVDTQYWTPAFTLWVIYRLASILALAVTRKADVAKSYREMADLQFRRAKARDAQQVTTNNVSLSRYHQIRNGSGLFVKIDGSES
jgi:hypothetical protein|tara:strand:+ start:192 stop:818 length:627 start_codon:yes stop_codon:yes gene_type:complete